MAKRKRMRGGADVPVLTKQEVLADPKIKQALQSFVAQQGGGRQRGFGWWQDFVSWLQKNKVISTASKIGAAIAGAVGFVPLSTALGAVSTGSAALGYGRTRGGMYSYADAQAIARGITRKRGGSSTPIAYPSVPSENASVKF